ncbi:MAG: glutathione peroxidase [Burkholderiales bacterium]|nr:glutathione peroxidase [Burkholderiales bacterium]
MIQSIYDFKVKTISGDDFDLSELEGKVILVVNTASKCGFTPQYAELEELYKEFSKDGFVILGFPCNQFGGQEPATENVIQEFCQLNYGVTFPMMAKIDVNGANESPLYTYLKNKAKGILGSKSIKWNFTKFLINRDAKVIVRYAPTLKPSQLKHGIKSLLEDQ